MSTDLRDRDQRILALLDSGQHSIQEVADLFGVSRQRVHQIYQQERQKQGQSAYYRPVRKTYRAMHPVVCKECSRKAVERGYCAAHYHQLRYRGDSEVRKRALRSSRRYYWSHYGQRLAYQKEYRTLHRDRLRQYYRQHHDEELERARRYRETHRDEINARARARYWAKKQTKSTD